MDSFKLMIVSIIILSLGLDTALANDQHFHEETFPEWTYYGEIVEHSIMMVIPVVAIILLIKPYRKERSQGLLHMILGLAILFISQLLTNLHHFLIYPFGIWNAIVHHGLLLIAITIMIYAFFELMEK